jgi:transcriptional regulator with XRE-family HTH domain
MVLAVCAVFAFFTFAHLVSFELTLFLLLTIVIIRTVDKLSIGKFLKFGNIATITTMSSNSPVSFGVWVAQRRKEKGFKTQKLFSEATGFSDSYISRVELGEREPTRSFCVAIAPVLDLPIEYVLEVAGLTDEMASLPTKDFADVEETQTILNTFPSAESRRRAVQIANNLLRQLAQNERESARQTGGINNEPSRKTARRNATA